jgi:RNA polymerase sigma-70 factor, ECF subfamily
VPQSAKRSVPAQMSEGCLPMHMREEEINELFAACLPKLKKAARRMLRNQQDCEDVLQEGLLLAFRKLHQFEGRSSFLTWLYSIVRNTSRIHYRKTTGRPTMPLESGTSGVFQNLPESEFVETRPSPEELCIQNERSEILRRTARRMPARYQPAIEYFHLEGLGEEETARRLQVTVSALKSQLHRSRHMLISRMRRSQLAGNRQGWNLMEPIALSPRCVEEGRLDLR